MTEASSTEPTVSFTVNGEACQAASGTRLLDFLEERGLDPARIAVERNRDVVPRSSHADVQLAEGDQFEIVHFVGGG